MKSFTNVALFLALIILIPAASASAFDLTEAASGAASLGMGGLTAVLPKDSFAFNNNPAGLAALDKINISSLSGNLMGQFNYFAAGGSLDLLGARMAISYTSSATPDIPYTDTVDDNGRPTDIQIISYTNSVLGLAYGMGTGDFSVFKNTSLGARAKLFRQSFSGLAPSASGFNLDLGAQADLTKDLSCGLILKNFIPAGMGGKIHWSDGVDEALPKIVVAGLGWKALEGKLFLGVDSRFTWKGVTTLHGGAQWSIVDYFSLRGGLDQVQDLTSTRTNLTLGLNLNYKMFSFDYAYHKYGSEAENDTHYFSLGLSF